MGPHVFNRAEGFRKSKKITDFVHSRIEECMQINMGMEETVKLIYDTFGINSNFTRSIWYLLEKANPDFFSWFNTHCERLKLVTSQASKVNVGMETFCKSDEDLPKASTSYKEPDNKPIARLSKEEKLQLLLSFMAFLTETDPNYESSQLPQEAATANAGDVPIPIEKNISSKAKQSKARKKAKKQKKHAPSTGTATDVERAEVSQECLPIADAEMILKEISTSLGLLQSIIEPVHKLLSNGFVPLRSPSKVLKKQRSWEQVRSDYEQAEPLQDLNQQLQQEMQRFDILGNQANEEDTLYD